jgi:hypothetical protein
MMLNDYANDQERQRLLPYVTRLACADTPEIEAQRAAYIHRYTQGHYLLPFEVGLEVLEGALALGRQADTFPAEEVKIRMGTVQAQATTPTSVPDTPLFAKIKNWLTSKETA